MAKLIAQIIQKLAPPQEPDPERQRIANTLAIVIPAVILVHLLFRLLVFAAQEELAVKHLSTIVIILIMPIYILSYRAFLLRKYDAASRLIVVGMWVALTINLFLRGNIQFQIFNLFFILILIAGYLLSLREAVGFVIITTVTTLLLWWNESFSKVSNLVYPPTGVVILLMKLFQLAAIGVFIILATRRIRIILHNLQQANVEIKKNETQLAEVNRSLLVQSELLQTIIDNLPGRIAYIDSSGIVKFMSRQFSDIGMEPSDSVGKLMINTMSKKQVDILKSYMQDALSGNKVVWELDIPFPNGTRIVAAAYVPHLVDGMVQGFVSLARDVTEERKTEAAVRQAQKLHSLGLLAGGVAHDFNNLLSAIMGQSSLAMVKMKEQHPAYRHVAKVVDASERAAMLTQQMLAYSGRGQFEVRQLNLNELIDANVQLFQVSIPKNIQLRTRYFDTLSLIEADAGQMQQVMMNLILNAAQAIGENQGIIEIITNVQEVAKDEVAYRQYTGKMLPPGCYVTVMVQDDGCGMDKKTAVRIFDPFFTTKESGSGLGLAAVLGIVRGHKGSLQVYSELNKGTIFKLLLPVAIPIDDAQIEEVQEVEETAVSPTGSILIIDDETAVCEVAADILTAAGWHTYTANSGQEGLNLYQQHQADIQLILLDLSMPNMDGKKTFYKLRQINPAVRVLLTSGYDKTKATQPFIGHQLIGFIQKPYHANDLVQFISDCLQ